MLRMNKMSPLRTLKPQSFYKEILCDLREARKAPVRSVLKLRKTSYCVKEKQP
jgi:hypothetical protein